MWSRRNRRVTTSWGELHEKPVAVRRQAGERPSARIDHGGAGGDVLGAGVHVAEMALQHSAAERGRAGCVVGGGADRLGRPGGVVEGLGNRAFCLGTVHRYVRVPIGRPPAHRLPRRRRTQTGVGPVRPGGPGLARGRPLRGLCLVHALAVTARRRKPLWRKQRSAPRGVSTAALGTPDTRVPRAAAVPTARPAQRDRRPGRRRRCSHHVLRDDDEVTETDEEASG